MNPDPPLTIGRLASFVKTCSYMARSRCWKERLLLRLAKAHLDLLTQQAIERGTAEQEKSWARSVKR